MIKLITVGVPKNNEFASISNFYQKLISQYTKIDIIEVVPKANKSGFEKIQKHISPVTYLLDAQGKEYTSRDFASIVIESNIDMGKGITFIVGGPFGFSDLEKREIKNHISISKLTTTHQLTRLVLLEQIYRAFTIINGKSYHY